MSHERLVCGFRFLGIFLGETGSGGNCQENRGEGCGRKFGELPRKGMLSWKEG